MYEHDESNVVVIDQEELGVDVESGCGGVVDSRCPHGAMAENARADGRGMYSWWWDSHISPKNSKWLCENLRDMDVKVKQMIKIIEEDADSFARRAEMYYERRPELLKLAEEFYRAYRALAERYGHATGVLRFAHKTMAEAFPDKAKSMPANGRTSVNCGDDSEDMPPETIDFEIAALMGLPEGFLSPDIKAGFDVLDGLFDSSSTEKGYFYSRVEVEGFEQAMTGTDEAEKEAAANEMAKSLERINDLELELARVQDNCHQLKERTKEAESEIGHVKKAHLELEATREAHILEYRKCLSEIKEIRTQASKVENELKKDVIREKTEKESAIQAFSRCLGMLLKLQKRFQHVNENAGEGEFGNESESETLDRHLENVDEGWSFAEKLNLDLLSGLDALTQKTQSKDAEIFEKQKELGRLWTCVQEERLHHVDVEDSLQKLKNIWFQSQEETRSLFTQLQEKVRLLEDAESRIECLHEEIHKVQEENTVLSEANTASSDLIWHLEKAISSDNERLQKLEADSERQSSILQKVHSIGLDPENLVPSINDLYAKFTVMNRTLEQERSERTALRVKLAVLDEFVEKNVLLEVHIFHLETQLEEFRDKVQFLEESCESLLEEKLKTTHERDLLASQLQEAADQSNKLKEMNRRLETSLLDANSQLQALMMRAKGIKDYLQNAEKDNEELQNKYLVLEKEKESLMSKIVQLQIVLDMKEEFEEELEKSLDANMGNLFSSRAVQDFEEGNSSFRFKFQTLVEAWKISQVQISYLEHENLVQQSELQFLSDQIDVGKASIHAMLKSYPRVISPEEPFKPNCDDAKNIIQEVHDWHESLSWIEEAYLEASVEKSVLGSLLVQMKRESAEVVSDLNMLKIENCHLKELLERSMNEIGEIKSENDLLQCEVLCGKDLLGEKESRNMKIEKMLKAVDGEKKEMQRKVYNLKMELTNTKLAKQDQEKQIFKLSDDLTRQIVESEYLREEMRRMECHLLKVREEYREVCRKERIWSNNVEIGEARIAAVFCDVVSSNIRESILEDRVREVAEAYQKESKGKNTEIERLREIVRGLESGNVELVSRLDALKMETNRLAESAMEQNGSPGVNSGDATKDNKDSNLKKHEPGICPGDDDNVKIAEMVAFYQPASEISLAQNEFMTKEIVLDQSLGFFSYAGGRTLAVEADDRMLELWETSDASSNINLKVGKPLKATRLDDPNFDHEARKDGSVLDHCEEDSLDEKELGVDKQELSESTAEHKQGVSKRRLLERLNTDAQKLTNLHITLNDLQRMVELILRSGQERGEEYDAVNAQLEEARITTTKLSEANTKLIKAVEKRFRTRPSKPTSEAMDDGGSFIRRRISEKARRGSEKVAKLQTEVQKMQFLLLKLGEQKENKGRARVVDRKPRVLLKDYLNSRLRGGGGGGGQKQKKGQFCACVQLPSRRN